MKRTLPLLLVLVGLAQSSLADDVTRNVQGELKKEGFYFGEIDGTAGSEYTAALRRYQIRNGLEVTGQTNEETLGALGLAGNQRPTTNTTPVAPPPTAPATKPRVDLRREEKVVESDRRALQEAERNTPPRPAPPQRIFTPPPRDPSIVAPPADFGRPYPQGDYRYRELFEATPYASAPRPLQEQTLRAAQKSLAREGFYDGAVDGVPGPGTTNGIVDYQRSRRLPSTGRLDLETLAEMRLLPGVGSENPSLRPFKAPGKPYERRTYRGVWVR